MNARAGAISVFFFLAAHVEGARRPKESAESDGAFSYVFVLGFTLFVGFLFVRAIGAKEARSIGDNFKSSEEVAAALRRHGLESCELVIGVDFTKSNEWNGERTFRRKCLHHVKGGASANLDMSSLHTSAKKLNPYQYAIALITKTLGEFDDDQKIHAYGFGDSSTQDESVFSFQPHGAQCAGLHDVLHRYNDIASSPKLQLSGPTSFVPLINQTIDIVSKSGKFHILVIIADGQVTNESLNIDAIVDASAYPISIIMVGVGDGPWDVMEKFDDRLPKRKFDNFQFVQASSLLTPRMESSKELEAKFVLRALMEVPFQFSFLKENGMLGKNNTIPCRPEVRVVDPPDRKADKMYPEIPH